MWMKTKTFSAIMKFVIRPKLCGRGHPHELRNRKTITEFNQQPETKC